MSLTYFHGSGIALPKGTILVPRGIEGWKNDPSHLKVEAFRPHQFLSREKAVFMSQDLDELDLSGASTNHVYEVQPLGPVQKHDINWLSEIDMVISELADGRDQEDEDVIEEIEKIAKKYWMGEPYDGESVWEFLTPSAKVIKEVDF